MRTTSFGEMTILKEKEGEPEVEFLVFEKEGRPHAHEYYESFVVTAGSGVIRSGKQSFKVGEGDIVTIPPKTAHWMIPDHGQRLEGLLWYHQTPTQLYGSTKKL